MTLQSRLAAHAPDRPSAVTVGTFDGVHLGHRRLLAEVLRLARGMSGPAGGAAVAIVFRQQPRSLIQPDRPVTYIQSFEDRLAALADTGLDSVIPVDFDPALRSLAPREFALDLHTGLQMRHLVLGPGAAIGRDRAGNAAVLRAVAGELGFDVHTVEPALHEGHVVSSSAIRTAIADGRLHDAGGMLGRRFVLGGLVEDGDRRGRELGFPTANLAIEPQLVVPRDGIYATWALLPSGGRSTRMPAATSIGTRPTFGGTGRRVEAHLIGFDGDLYGKPLGIEFVARLRDEQKFDNAEALIQQMRTDVAETLKALGAA